MIFLNPSILFGLLAATIPILIHILNLRKLQKVEFSTLSFLKELQKSKIRKIKIKQWLLLLLRTLIIIFLVLAFSRPTLETVNFTGISSSAKSTSVFFIDNSLSMNYITEDGTNLNRSKKAAKNILNQMEDGDEFIFLISLDSSKITTSKEIANNIIDELDLTFVTENNFDKIKKAIQLLEQSKNINKEVFFFSDLQSSTFFIDDSINSIISNNNVKTYVVDMSAQNYDNYGVSNLILTNSIIEINKPLTFSAIISNYSENQKSNITASLFLNDKRVAQQSINLFSKEEKTVEFETTLKSSGLFEARIELEDDNLNEDNVCYLNFNVPEKIKILLQYENINDIQFLEAALNSSSTSGQLEVTKSRFSDNSNINLTDFDMIFIVGETYNKTDDLNKYFSSNGKVVFIPSSNFAINGSDVLSLNLLKIKEFIKTDKSERSYNEFGKINFQHPIFQNLFENQTQKNIESPIIFNYLKFQENNSVTPIIRLLDESIFLGELKKDNGKFLFFNTAFVLDWNNFAIKGIFAPLISKIIYYLASSNSNGNSYLTGESINIDVSKLIYPIIDVNLPGRIEKLNLQNEKSTYNYYNTFINGSYKFFSNNNLFSFASVNINSKESNLLKIERDSLTQILNEIFDENYLLIEPNSNYLETIKEAKFGTELWKPFLIIAFIIALFEMFIARSTKKDISHLN
ncbi:MAG: BatA and WFA domain-containing protein [Ignavibacteriae bacterium]|nr:BatA and WFA domain-containing protein [Ignavibacteriota bacterium]MCB9207987.1 BatA domain-containing protein [Ignavibacteriales bacterium]MCB9258756.1 BatA domain-containing protein [Ignavibacteriales bacterium]